MGWGPACKTLTTRICCCRVLAGAVAALVIQIFQLGVRVVAASESLSPGPVLLRTTSLMALCLLVAVPLLRGLEMMVVA